MTDPNTAGIDPAAPSAAPNPQGNTAGNTPMVPITALHEEREKRQSLASEVEALKAQLSRSSAPAQPTMAPAAQPVTDDVMMRKQLDDLWRDDPRKAMQVETQIALNWRDNVEAYVDSQMEEMSNKYKDFGNYQKPVRQLLRQIPLDQRAKPGVVEAAFFMAKGQKTEDIIKAEVEARLKKMTSADLAAMSAGGSSGGGQPASSGLSPEEKTAAMAMGISETEYLKFRK